MAEDIKSSVLCIENINDVISQKKEDIKKELFSKVQIKVQNVICDGKDSEFEKVMQLIKWINSNQLESLSIDFNLSVDINITQSFETIFELKRNIYPMVKKLKCFELNLDNWGNKNPELMADNCFPIFFRTVFSEMKEVTDINLSFQNLENRNSTITESTLKGIFQFLPINNLQQLRVDLSRSNGAAPPKFRPQDFDAIFQRIFNEGQQLSSLCLNLNGFYLSRNGLYLLSEGLQKIEKTLTHLELHLIQYQRRQELVQVAEMTPHICQILKNALSLPLLKTFVYCFTLPSVEARFFKDLSAILVGNDIKKYEQFDIQIKGEPNELQKKEASRFTYLSGIYFGQDRSFMPFLIDNEITRQEYQKIYLEGMNWNLSLKGLVILRRNQQLEDKYRSELIVQIQQEFITHYIFEK